MKEKAYGTWVHVEREWVDDNGVEIRYSEWCPKYLFGRPEDPREFSHIEVQDKDGSRVDVIDKGSREDGIVTQWRFAEKRDHWNQGHYAGESPLRGIKRERG